MKMFLMTLAVVVATESLAPAQAPQAPKAEKKIAAWVRCLAALGDQPAGNTFTLSYKGSGPRTEGSLFANKTGNFRLGYGSGYGDMAPGKYHFQLFKDGEPPNSGHSVEVDLKKNSAYTLFAVLADGRPQLQVIQEWPVKPGEEGVYVYHLVPGNSLSALVNDTVVAGFSYAPSPYFLAPEKLKGQPVTLSFLTKRKTTASTMVEYTGGRISAIFVRNHYNQPSVEVVPSAPPTE